MARDLEKKDGNTKSNTAKTLEETPEGMTFASVSRYNSGLKSRLKKASEKFDMVKDHVLDHIDTYIEEAIKDTDDELLGGMIVAEFLGVCHYFDFIVMEEGDKKWKNMVSGTDSIH